MPYLVETSILGRLANQMDANYHFASQAVFKLHQRGEILYLAPQSIVEFHTFVTRPVAVNGLGLTVQQAETHVTSFEADFSLLPETTTIYLAWKALVHAAGTVGKQVHDARLVAICQTEGISYILTFNVGHFASLAHYVPGLTIIHPATV